MVNMARSLDCGHMHSTMKKDGKAQHGLIALHGLNYCYQEYLHIYLGGERHCESKCLTQDHSMMTPRPGLKKVWITCSGGKCTNLNLRAIIAFQADLLKLVTPWSRVAPQNCLLDGQAISIHWWLAFVSKEPIPCSVNVDTSVVCQVLICIVWAHLYCEIFAFEGQNVENNNFSMKSNVGYKCCI